MEIRVPAKEENKKVIKFLNKVFHKPFPNLIPSLYGKDKNMMDYHFVVEDNGELVGAVCAYPETIRVGEIALRGIAMGMVATKKSARGKGVMTYMLNHTESLYSKDYDVAFLTGRRHRYEHFGYYPAGNNYIYNISDMSIKKWQSGCPYSIIKAKSKEDFLKVDELNNSANVIVERPFAKESETLRNWFSSLYLILKEGEVVGFASGKLFKGQTLERIYIKNGSVDDYIYGVQAYKKYKKATNLKVEAVPNEDNLIKALHACAEDYCIESHAKYKVFSYKRLIEKLLAIGIAQGRLMKFNKVVEILGREKLSIEVSDGNVKVTESTLEADLVLSEEEAIASLLGAEESIVKGIGKFSLRHSDFI